MSANLRATGVPNYQKPAVTPDLMGFDWIPDWDKRLARQDAFWHGAIIDRPVISLALAEPDPAYPAPAAKTHATERERWLDAGYVADCALHTVMNKGYMGDALPYVMPNLGPEVFSAFFGTELEYGPSTAWSIANLTDWKDVNQLRFSIDNFYWKKTLEMTDALLAIGHGKFYTGVTDLHPGGDAITAFRDPLRLNMDMLDCVDNVKALLKRVDSTFLDVFDYFMDLLQSHGQAITTWPGITSTKRWHVPSNDFSCMISKTMFDEVFLPGIAAECEHAEASIYHLDGPNALQHLDSLLAIKRLNAIQWIPGAGHGDQDWTWVHQKCQAAGKGIQVMTSSQNLDQIMQTLRPEGAWLRCTVKSREEGEFVLKRISQWT